jgi:hypothetical protein
MRNREIQRRSRARRKEYVEDLEKRVRQYERDGVKVTTEVQAAAREVAEENFWLHSLLEKHGISPVEIKDYLDSNRAASCSLGSEVAKGPGKKVSPQNHIDYRNQQPSSQVEQSFSRPQASPTAHGGGDIGLMSPKSVPASPEHEILLYNIDKSIQEDEARASSMATETLDHRSLPEKSPALCPPCRSYERDGTIRRADETSCEDAARIIASMRGHEDPEGVWPELGCSATRSCMVKNITIFQMVDERERIHD